MIVAAEVLSCLKPASLFSLFMLSLSFLQNFTVMISEKLPSYYLVCQGDNEKTGFMEYVRSSLG